MTISIQNPFNEKQKKPKALSRQQLDSLRFALLRCLEEAGFRITTQDRMKKILEINKLEPHANMFVDAKIVTKSFSSLDEVHDTRLFECENKAPLKKVATNQTWVLDTIYDQDVSMLNMSVYVYDSAHRLHCYNFVVESDAEETNIKLYRITKIDTSPKKHIAPADTLDETMQQFDPETGLQPQFETIFDKTIDTHSSNEQLCENIGNTFLNAFKTNITKHYFELASCLRNWRFSRHKTPHAQKRTTL